MRQADVMPRSRLGVVLLVPDPWAREVDGLRRACRDSSLGAIAAHITLISPINVRDEHLDQVIEQVRAAASEFRPLRLRLSGAATFAPATPVVYLGVGGDLDRLLDLRQKLVTGPLERPDRYPYVPHVTVADDGTVEQLQAIAVALGGYEADIMVHGVHLLRQHDDRTWRPVSHAAFAPPAVIGRGGLPLELITSELPLQDRDGWCIAARRQQRVVGQATGHIREHRCVIDSFWVDVRGEGVGSHLAAAMESLAATRGCDQMLLLVDGEDDADGFWRARGWTEGPSALKRMVR